MDSLRNNERTIRTQQVAFAHCLLVHIVRLEAVSATLFKATSLDRVDVVDPLRAIKVEVHQCASLIASVIPKSGLASVGSMSVNREFTLALNTANVAAMTIILGVHVGMRACAQVGSKGFSPPWRHVSLGGRDAPQ